ncbi:hypothetical protein [Pseudomonas sp. 22 E 5]|nr:hypothetical protein [Pseudomonas sp. 22 E 5]
MGRHRRTLVIERQLQHRLLTAQQVTPVIELARFFPGLHPVTLPFCVVGILDRHRRQLQRLALAVGSVELHQLVDHHLHGPTVGDDVVLHQDQHVLLCCQAQKIHTHQRPLAQVERSGYQRFNPGLELGLVGGFRHQLDPCLRADHLYRAVGLLLQVRAQAVMARYQGIEGTLQGHLVQRTFQAQRTGHVIGRTVRVQLPEKPLTLLGVGQQQGLSAVYRDQRRCRTLDVAQAADKVAKHRLFKQRLERDFDAQAVTHPRHHLRGEQRMTTHFEEVIVEPYPLGAQHLGPDGSDALLLLSHGRDPFGQRMAGIRLGQRGTIYLAVGAQRQAFQHQ